MYGGDNMAYQESKVLEITPEEKEAIEWYQGNSTEINELMGNFISDSAKESYYHEKRQNGKVQPYYTSQSVEQVMERIEKIYSAMLKTSMNSPYAMRSYMYRGSPFGMKNGVEQAFISATTSQNEALSFATSKQYYDSKLIPHFSYINIAGKIPHYFMPDKGNENEIVLSPFTNIKVSNSRYGRWSERDIILEDVRIEPMELRDFSDLDKAKAKEDLLKSAESIGVAVNEYIKLERKLNTDVKYDPQVMNEMKENLNEIESWKKDFRNLMEARCRDIEKRIELELEREAEEERKRQAEEARIKAEENKKEEDKQRANSLSLKDKIRDTKEVIRSQLRGSIQMYKDAKRFGIDYKSPTNDIMSLIDSWNFNGDRIDDNTLHRVNGVMQEVKSKSRGEELSEIEENEIKKAMAEKVMKIRLQQEMGILQEEVATVRNQKIGLFRKNVREREEEKRKRTRVRSKN